MKKIISLSFIIVSLLFVNASIANACSCTQSASPKESLEQATAVFAGKVININTPDGIILSSNDPIKVTFEVSKMWKGPDYKTLVLTTARDKTACGYSFKQNQEYIVYAYGEENKLNTGICSRTKLFASAQDDLQALGIDNLPTNSGSSFVILIISIIGIAIVLFGLVVFLIKKYKILSIMSKRTFTKEEKLK